MKSVFRLGILILSLIVFIAGCSSKSSSSNTSTTDEDNQDEKITLIFSGAHSTTHSIHTELAQPFMDRVVELTDGQVEFEYYPAEQLGKASDLIDLANNGTTDIAYYASPYYPSKMPIGSNLVGMPRLFENGYIASMAFHQVSLQSPVLETDFLNNGVRPIMTYATPPFQFYTKDAEIKSPEDLKGLAVRAPGGVQSEVLEFLGATPVSVTTQEMYEAFDRGILNVLFSAEMSMHDIGLHELIEFATQGVNYGTAAVGYVISEEKYQSLPKEIQEAIDQAGLEATENYSKFIMEATEKAIEEWKAAGTTIYEMSEEEIAEWEKAANEFNESWLEQQGSEDFNKAYELLLEQAEKYR